MKRILTFAGLLLQEPYNQVLSMLVIAIPVALKLKASLQEGPFNTTPVRLFAQ